MNIKPLTLIAIILIVIGFGLMVGYYYTYQEDSCVKDPVAYANNHSYDYWWTYVTPISIGDFD